MAIMTATSAEDSCKNQALVKGMGIEEEGGHKGKRKMGL